MRRVMLIILCIVFVLTGCGGTPTVSDKINVVVTIFPIYDWVREILGSHVEDVELTMLLDSKVDLHSYQPTAEDLVKISNCDIFIYVGGESDSWVDSALQQIKNSDVVVINLLEALGDAAKEEEVIEGMEFDDDEDTEDLDEIEYDEHVWLSLRNAITLCSTIADVLCVVDSDNSSDYSSNASSYIRELESLDTKYVNVVSSAPVQTLLFGDRFPFRYLIDDYCLNYYAAFSGCSAETEASFETISFLATKIDELELNHVAVIEGSDTKIADTIVANTLSKNQDIVFFNSMQSVTLSDIAQGISYLSVMELNLEQLKLALSN